VLAAGVDQSWVSVGDDEDSVSSVVRIDGNSRKYEFPDFVVFSLQVSLHIVECHVDEAKNIFSNDPSWLGFLDNSKHLRPEMAVIV
jgi:hypothetical protein